MRAIMTEIYNLLDINGSMDQICFHDVVISHVDNDDIEGTEFCRACEALWMANRPMEMPDATG